MNALYLLTWLVARTTEFFFPVFGILLSAASALVSFVITQKFITGSDLNKGFVFFTGGLSFLLFILASSIFKPSPIQYFFNIEGSSYTIYGDVFIFWQLVVGATLSFELRTATTKQLADN